MRGSIFNGKLIFWRYIYMFSPRIIYEMLYFCFGTFIVSLVFPLHWRDFCLHTPPEWKRSCFESEEKSVGYANWYINEWIKCGRVFSRWMASSMAYFYLVESSVNWHEEIMDGVYYITTPKMNVTFRRIEIGMAGLVENRFSEKWNDANEEKPLSKFYL